MTQNSDSRLKQNIVPLNGSLQNLQRLNGYRYNWKAATADTTVQTGLLAQEVQSVFPELVKENDKGILSVNYTGLVPHLLEGLKEQQKQLDTLRSDNAELKARLERLEKLITKQ